jgi:hypothetical protein
LKKQDIPQAGAGVLRTKVERNEINSEPVKNEAPGDESVKKESFDAQAKVIKQQDLVKFTTPAIDDSGKDLEDENDRNLSKVIAESSGRTDHATKEPDAKGKKATGSDAVGTTNPDKAGSDVSDKFGAPGSDSAKTGTEVPSVPSPPLAAKKTPTLQDSQTTNISTKGESEADTFARSALSVNTVAQQLAALVRPSHQKLNPSVVEKFMTTTATGWSKLNKAAFAPLNNWRNKNISQVDGVAARVFYPFGGPDAAYVTQLFPNASEYILIGLEASGSIDSAINIVSTSEGLTQFNHGMEHFFKKGYFVTSYMGKQLSAQKMGIIPVVMSQLAQLGYEILDVKNESISSDGARRNDNTGSIKIMTIRFKRASDSGAQDVAAANSPSEGQDKVLIYVRCSLDNANEAILNIFTKYLKSKDFVTFIKSASYKLHDFELFSNMRAFILANSKAILQDDTGIPYKLLNKTFDITLFGYYDKPTLKVFQGYKQTDLAAAYKTQKPDPLPFLFGYGCLNAPSNLLLAIAKEG